MLETITTVTIQIPDDLARGLESMAARSNMSVEQLAVARLRDLLDRRTSPRAVLAALQALRHPSSCAVDDLEAAISAGHLPARERGFFDK